MKSQELIQNSPEWYEWRLGGIGASEVAAIMGICPYTTPHGVWLVKTKRSKGFDGNSFTQHGQETEAKARARYELISMMDMGPACATHPKHEICRASLDGISEDGKLILELKCPKSRKTLDEALQGKIPEHYIPQVQYQLAVTGADEADFFVYHEDSGEHALVKVKSDVTYQGKIIAVALDFWEKFVLSDTPPPLTEDDVKVIERNSEIEEICRQILEAMDFAPKAEINKLKAKAISLAGHPKMRFGSVQISTVNRNGSFSFHKLTIRKENEKAA